MKIGLSSKGEYEKMYFKFFQNLLNLTDREIDILAIMYKTYLELKDRTTNEEDCREILFSTRYRKKYREHIGISDISFNNYFQSLIKKGFIKREGSTLYLNPKYTPQKEFTIVITE